MRRRTAHWLPLSLAVALTLATLGALPNAVHADVIFGNSQVASGTDSNAAGSAEAFRYAGSANGTVGAINVYVDGNSAATALITGIYADNAGHPGSLVAQGSLASLTRGDWNSVVIAATLVTSSATYWIAILGTGGALAFRDHCCGAGTVSESGSQTNLGSLPATWSSGARWSDGPASIYASSAPPPPPPPPPPPSQQGQWSSVMNWPIVAVHAVLLSNGMYLLWDGWANPIPAQLWDPATQMFTTVTAPSDIFCAGQATMPDGRVLVVGGQGSLSTGQEGLVDTNIFDPSTSTWRRVANMHDPRWYPSVTELGDGRFVAISGESLTAGNWSDTPEVYDPSANTWTALSGVSTSQMHEQEYPFSYLTPNGRVFSIAQSVDKSFSLDVANQTWTPVGGASGIVNGSSVMYQPGKILYSGGSNASTTTTFPAKTTTSVIDMNAATPAWRQTAPMNDARWVHTLTVLADGNVLAVGGAPSTPDNATDGVLQSEMWNPVTQTWSTMASIQVARNYHSTASLMPDGRVLVAGGGHDEGANTPGQFSAQIYSPPYIFKGNRPTITGAPSTTTYGSTMSITTPDAAAIGGVNLVSMAADTHQIDMNQHFVPLSFTTGPGGLTVQSPPAANLAPPGNYMIFIVNGSGVPSVAATVHLTGAADTTPPAVTMTAPANGATVSGSSVTVSATASDSGSGVASVQLLLDGAPMGPPVTSPPYSTTWDSTPAANGMHTLTARATDNVGNIATAMPVSVTVANAPPPPGSLGIDASASKDGRGTVSVIGFTAPTSGDLLLASVSSDGPSGGGQRATVSGGGLTWSLLKRTNTQLGDAEVWGARAAGQLSGASVTSTPGIGGYDQSLTVVALHGAGGTGATASASGPNGGPSVNLTTTKAGSLVFAAGNDWDAALARAPGSGQSLLHQWLDTGTGDTLWVQQTVAGRGAAGSAVRVNDTAPTSDQWNLAAVEVVAG